MRTLFRLAIMRVHNAWLRCIWGYDVHPSTMISFGAYLDRTYPQGVHIGAESIVTRGAVILSHDYSRHSRMDTVIGKRCMIGVNAIVLPGVRIGDEVVIGAGAIVTRDVESNSLAVGNPARILRHIRTQPYGRIVGSLPDAN